MRISDWSSDVCSSDLDANGLINIAAFEALLGRDVAVVSVMAVNNEIGTIQPLETIRDRAFRIGAFFHTDATQAPAAMPNVVAEWGVDAASFSGHKIYGDRKSVVEGKSVSVRVDLGGRSILKKKTQQ